MNLSRASQRLSELDLKTTVDNLNIDVLWFRVMEKQGEWVINRHTHSSYEFHFVHNGVCRIILDDGEFEAEAGSFYLTAPGVYHEQQSISGTDYTEYSINCDLKPVNTQMSEALSILRLFDETPCKPIIDSYSAMKYFNKALKEAHDHHIGYYNIIRNQVFLILSSAARAMKKDPSSSYDVPLKKSRDSYRFAQIEKFIMDNVYNNITPGDIAKYIFLSEKQLCRIIREKSGVSTKDLIMRAKLQKAKEMLKETGLSIRQISDNLGFSSEYYFNQFFKRTEGYPPGFYRSNIQDA